MSTKRKMEDSGPTTTTTTSTAAALDKKQQNRLKNRQLKKQKLDQEKQQQPTQSVTKTKTNSYFTKDNKTNVKKDGASTTTTTTKDKTSKQKKKENKKRFMGDVPKPFINERKEKIKIMASSPVTGTQEEIPVVSIGSNWQRLKSATPHLNYNVKKNNKPTSSSISTPTTTKTTTTTSTSTATSTTTSSTSRSVFDLITVKDDSITKQLAVDCEMVEVEEDGKKKNALGHVCIVNSFGNIVYSNYCKPEGRITDYRTRWSGLRKSDLQDAIPFEEVQQKVEAILKDKIVIGHSLQTDLTVLKVHVDSKHIRDGCSFPDLQSEPNEEGRRKPIALKKLAETHLGVDIQVGRNGHSSAEDATASMFLYLKYKKEWENYITTRFYPQRKPSHVKAIERQEQYLEAKKVKDFYFNKDN